MGLKKKNDKMDKKYVLFNDKMHGLLIKKLIIFRKIYLEHTLIYWDMYGIKLIRRKMMYCSFIYM